MFKRQFKISFQATYNNLGSCEEEVNEDNSCFTQCRAFDFEKLAVVSVCLNASLNASSKLVFEQRRTTWDFVSSKWSF